MITTKIGKPFRRLSAISWKSESLLFAVLIYRLLLDIHFVVFLEPHFYHMGFAVNFSVGAYLLSLVMLILNFVLMKRTARIDTKAWFFLFLILLVPFTSYYAMTNDNTLWFLMITSIWSLGTIFINTPFLFRSISMPLVPSSVFVALTLSSALILIFVIFRNVDINFSMGLFDVYEIRKLKPTAFIPFSDYIINFFTKAALPIVLIIAMKRWNVMNGLVFFTAVGCVLFFFFATGHKAFLFNIPFLILLYLLARSKNFYAHVTLFFVFVVMGSSAVFFLFDQVLPMSLFYRRTLMMPAQLSFLYFDFYQDHSLYLSNSIFRSFLNYPDPMAPANMIADHYFYKPQAASSNGFLSDGFRHFGVVGTVIWTVLLGFILKILANFKNHVPESMVLVMTLLFCKTIMDGPVLTSLLTHGFLFVILSFVVLKFPNQSNPNK